MGVPYIEIGIILALILCSAFFSGSETALTAVSRARMYQRAKAGSKVAALIIKLQESKESLIGGILLGNNLVNIASTALATTAAIQLWGVEWGPLYATIIMTLVVLIFAEILPKTIALNNAEGVALWVARPIKFITDIFAPVTRMIQYFIRHMLENFGVKLQPETLTSSHEVIRGAIALHTEEGDFEKEDRDMLGSILDLDARHLEEVMVHRTQVNAIDISLPPEEIVELMIGAPHSRIPLWKDSSDNIVGVLHAKDVLRMVRAQTKGITREMIRRRASRPWFVPESTTLSQQLLAFRAKRKHFALVVNEYGEWQGIVTLEDIIEEIVGEIDDEHDVVALDDIIPFGKGAHRVGGAITIRDINRHLDWQLPDEDATTIAGLVLHEARAIPQEGAVFEFYGVRFTVLEKEGNQITRLQVEEVLSES